MKKTRTARERATTVSATTAAKNFGALVDRVREAGVAYVVERKGRPIARIDPVVTRRCSIADLAAWLERQRALPEEYTGAVGAHIKTANRPRVPATRWRS